MVDADHLYGADSHWWTFHHADISIGFGGKKWSCDPLKEGKRSNTNWNNSDPDKWGITVLGCHVCSNGLSTDKETVISGGNSGYQAINLAMHLGATRIILIGFDMTNHSGKTHFFGDHPDVFKNGSKPDRFIAAFRTIKPAQYGIEILNCSRITALDAFPRFHLEDVF